MKAIMSVDPRLFKLLGKKLYSSSPIVIAVRELYQNSVDACKRAGVEPKISIEIHLLDDDNVKVICDDNGCGMTEDDIVSKFLCLGGTSKTSLEETGRFGVAKVALMCGESWNCHTQDNYLNNEFLINDKDIEKIEYRQGTRIEIVYADESYIGMWYELCVVTLMFSDYPVHFLVTSRGNTRIDSVLGGTQEKIQLVAEENWTGYAIPSVSVESRTFSGNALVRMNGLVQFRLPKSYREQMRSNLLIDLTTDLSPDHKDFPLVMSREKLVGEVSKQVERWHESKIENPLSTDFEVKRGFETQEVKFRSGKLMRGKRKVGVTEIVSGQTMSTEEIERLMTSGAAYSENVNSEFKETFITESKNPLIKMTNYSNDPKSRKKHAALISVWVDLLQLVLYEDIQFAVGVFEDTDAVACFEVENGVNFFSFNPSIFESQMSKPESMILNMYTTVVHETAHVWIRTHNEVFTSFMNFTFVQTSEQFMKILFAQAAAFRRMF